MFSSSKRSTVFFRSRDDTIISFFICVVWPRKVLVNCLDEINCCCVSASSNWSVSFTSASSATTVDNSCLISVDMFWCLIWFSFNFSSRSCIAFCKSIISFSNKTTCSFVSFSSSFSCSCSCSSWIDGDDAEEDSTTLLSLLLLLLLLSFNASMTCFLSLSKDVVYSLRTAFSSDNIRVRWWCTTASAKIETEMRCLPPPKYW